IYTNINLSINDRAEIAAAQLVSGSYYRGLGVNTIIGRPITDEDDRIGAPPVAVITYQYWKDRFGSDPAIIGKSAFVNGIGCTIIGVSQPGFVGAMGVNRSADLSLPLASEQAITRRPNGRASYNMWLRIMG